MFDPTCCLAMTFPLAVMAKHLLFLTVMVEESASSREISLGLSRFAQFFSEASSSIGEILLKLSRFS